MTSPIVINIPGAKLLSSRGSGGNGRQHRFAKAHEVKQHRHGAMMSTVEAIVRVPGYAANVVRHARSIEDWVISARRIGTHDPFRVRLVILSRVCPRRYFCDGADNLRALFKATLDGVSDALGVNDKVFVDNPTESDIQNGKIAIRYEQIDGAWGVRITIEPAGIRPSS